MTNQQILSARSPRQPDLQALAHAARSLQQAYARLRPALVDPEKLTVRYVRVQQRAQWIVQSYGTLFPPDALAQIYGRLGRSYLSSPFDEAVPTRRAVVALRATARLVLAQADLILSGSAAMSEVW